jgi:hypothetical protein
MPTTTAVTGSVLANEITVTKQAQQAFEQAVTALTSIISSVFDSQQQLKTNAMVTTAGAAFGSGVVRWTEDFEDIRNTCNWMAMQLGDTATSLATSNQNNIETALTPAQMLPSAASLTTSM